MDNEEGISRCQLSILTPSSANRRRELHSADDNTQTFKLAVDCRRGDCSVAALCPLVRPGVLVADAEIEVGPGTSLLDLRADLVRCTEVLPTEPCRWRDGLPHDRVVRHTEASQSHRPGEML